MPMSFTHISVALSFQSVWESFALYLSWSDDLKKKFKSSWEILNTGIKWNIQGPRGDWRIFISLILPEIKILKSPAGSLFSMHFFSCVKDKALWIMTVLLLKILPQGEHLLKRIILKKREKTWDFIPTRE